MILTTLKMGRACWCGQAATTGETHGDLCCPRPAERHEAEEKLRKKEEEQVWTSVKNPLHNVMQKSKGCSSLCAVIKLVMFLLL